MKKIFTFISAIVLALGALTLTSCNQDQMIGMTLDGSWSGNMYIQTSWDGYTYQTTYSEIEFNTDPYSYASGYGYWVDYYSDAPWDYYASHIKWTVVNGMIRVYFMEDNYTMNIYDYSISNNRFEGVIYDDYGKAIQFSLRSNDPEDWGSYGYGWDAWNSFYSKSMTGTSTPSARFSDGNKPERHIVKVNN